MQKRRIANIENSKISWIISRIKLKLAQATQTSLVITQRTEMKSQELWDKVKENLKSGAIRKPEKYVQAIYDNIVPMKKQIKVRREEEMTIEQSRFLKFSMKLRNKQSIRRGSL